MQKRITKESVNKLLTGFVLGVATTLIAGTVWTDHSDDGLVSQGKEAPDNTSFVAPPQDLPEANSASVWEYLQKERYQWSWRLFPGTTELQEGGAPHGTLRTTYVNELAHDALTEGVRPLPVGAILIRDGYRPNGNLVATAVMIKRPAGYNPHVNDWYWLKRNAAGTVDVSGVAAVCHDCHSTASAGDYVMTEVE